MLNAPLAALHLSLVLLAARVRGLAGGDEQGFSTAELLGNAALGIVALVAIWALLGALGADVVDWIRGKLLTG